MLSHIPKIIFACPVCEERPPLREDGSYLVCDACKRSYPIINGIPHLLPTSGLMPEARAERERNH